MSALKLTFPTPLPKNEKDLICMLLAGRLKDLFKGRLVCAQLAIDDLLKDLTGFSALGSLQSSLLGMKGALDGFKAVSGYNNILNGVNQALGQVNNVFSLGGLCPSPVHAPKIPDLLGQLGTNLFGQGLNILNALGRLSNPSMCLGGKPPKGFGINWNSMPGDLKNLKAAIAHAKATGGGMTPALNAFVKNLESQTSAMKAEIKRLEKNLADPLGLNDKLNTARNLQRVKSISDGYPVKDARGITHPNVLKSMVPADIESVIDSGDKTPIKYITRAVVDYCGDVVGYEKVAVTGDSAYIGWDTNNDAVNTDNPTVNPVAGYLNYIYFFKQEGNVINVYDNTGAIVTDLTLSRGTAYRLGFELVDKHIEFYSDSAYTTAWTEGLTYSKNPEYGTDMEIIFPDVNTSFVRGELDWAVLIENPTTPNIIYWKADSTNNGSFTIDGITELPSEDKTYDISMAVKKACLHLVHATTPIPGSSETVRYEDFAGNPSTFATTQIYNTTTTIYNANGIGTPQTVNGVSLTVKEDIETSDELGNTDPNNKIIKSSARLTADTYLITKRYVSIENGLEYNQIGFYVSSTTNEENATACILLKFDDPITILNSSKLPFTDYYSYKLTILDNVAGEFLPRTGTTPISNSDETKFTLHEDSNGTFIRWNLTAYSEADKLNVPKNEFIFQTDIKIDPTDPGRTFISTNPIEYRTYFYFKLPDGTALDMTITAAT